ncbi:NAD(P)-dependent oxidoreductase [soil metagenome]
MTQQIVAVLGTGTMAAGMARSLLREGFDVRVWNRSPEKAQPLAADGASVTTDPAAAAAGAQVVITMLYDADSVIEVMSELGPKLDPEVVWLQTATIGIEGTQRVADLARSLSLKVLDAPVLGTKAPAEQGKLIPLVSGDPAYRELVGPVLDAIGARTVWACDDLGQGSALKLACNAWIASITAATAQSLALAVGLGLDPTLFFEAIKGGPSDAAYVHAKGQQMLDSDYTPSFALDGALKDVELISAAADKAGVDGTLLAALHTAYQAASASGHGKDDISAVYTSFRK